VKYLLLILVGVMLFGGGILLGLSHEHAESEPVPMISSANLEELILNMDVARQSHQYYLDNWHYWPQDLNRQRNWVDIYERVIKVLEGLR